MTDSEGSKSGQQDSERVESAEILEIRLTLFLIVIFAGVIGWRLFWLAYNGNNLVPAQYVSYLRNPAIGYCLWGTYLILLGVALRSLQCMLWVRTQPFRAVAIGRYLFGIFMIAEPAFVCLTEWPSVQAEVIVEKTPSSNLLSPNTYDVKDKTELRAANSVDYFWFLADRVKDFVGYLALFLGMRVLYRNFKRGRPEYTIDHFLSDVTLGKLGTPYQWGSPSFPVGVPPPSST